MANAATVRLDLTSTVLEPLIHENLERFLIGSGHSAENCERRHGQKGKAVSLRWFLRLPSLSSEFSRIFASRHRLTSLTISTQDKSTTLPPRLSDWRSLWPRLRRLAVLGIRLASVESLLRWDGCEEQQDSSLLRRLEIDVPPEAGHRPDGGPRLRIGLPQLRYFRLSLCTRSGVETAAIEEHCNFEAVTVLRLISALSCPERLRTLRCSNYFTSAARSMVNGRPLGSTADWSALFSKLRGLRSLTSPVFVKAPMLKAIDNGVLRRLATSCTSISNGETAPSLGGLEALSVALAGWGGAVGMRLLPGPQLRLLRVVGAAVAPAGGLGRLYPRLQKLQLVVVCSSTEHIAMLNDLLAAAPDSVRSLHIKLVIHRNASISFRVPKAVKDIQLDSLFGRPVKISIVLPAQYSERYRAYAYSQLSCFILCCSEL